MYSSQIKHDNKYGFIFCCIIGLTATILLISFTYYLYNQKILEPLCTEVDTNNYKFHCTPDINTKLSDFPKECFSDLNNKNYDVCHSFSFRNDSYLVEINNKIEIVSLSKYNSISENCWNIGKQYSGWLNDKGMIGNCVA